VLASVGLAIANGGPGELSIDSALGIDTVLDSRVGPALAGCGMALATSQIAADFRPRTNAEA
jgi:hypothetical protein